MELEKRTINCRATEENRKPVLWIFFFILNLITVIYLYSLKENESLSFTFKWINFFVFLRPIFFSPTRMFLAQIKNFNSENFSCKLYFFQLPYLFLISSCFLPCNEISSVAEVSKFQKYKFISNSYQRHSWLEKWKHIIYTC